MGFSDLEHVFTLRGGEPPIPPPPNIHIAEAQNWIRIEDGQNNSKER
jgi:hypothetical protein